jgi:RecA-family ATPase
MLTTHEKTREPEESLFLAALRDYIEAGKFTLVIVDPLARFAGADAEKDNASATRFIQALESLAKLGPTVIVAHHTNKIARRKGGTLDASASRGSSAIVDGARWQCALAVEQFENLEAYLAEVVTFAVTKSNYAPKPPPILLRRDLENAGALVECDEDMVATIEAARKKDAGHSEKRAAQDQDQEKRRLDRKARDDSERAERLKLADEAKAAAVAKDADTGIAILMEIPDCSARAFRAEMKARIGAGSERADAALIRAKKALKPEEKKENGS